MSGCLAMVCSCCRVVCVTMWMVILAWETSSYQFTLKLLLNYSVFTSSDVSWDRQPFQVYWGDHSKSPTVVVKTKNCLYVSVYGMCVFHTYIPLFVCDAIFPHNLHVSSCSHCWSILVAGQKHWTKGIKAAGTWKQWGKGLHSWGNSDSTAVCAEQISTIDCDLRRQCQDVNKLVRVTGPQRNMLVRTKMLNSHL